MAVSVDVYKGCLKLGSGTCTNGSTSLTTYTGTAPISGRNVQFAVTAAVSSPVGSSWKGRIVTDGGATLTLQEPCPFT